MSDLTHTTDELDPSEERAVDILLEEVFCDSTPPDLSAKILARLDAYKEQAGDDVLCQPDSVSDPSRPGRKSISITISLLAALAASLMLLFAWGPGKSNNEDTFPVAQDNADDIDRALADYPLEPPTGTDPVESQIRPPRGIPLVIGSESPPKAASDPIEAPPARTPNSDVAIALVSAEVETDLTDYWNAIEIEVTAEANAEATAKRLATRLGVELSPDAMGDSELVRRELNRHPRVSRSVARNWLQVITQGGLNRIDSETKERLIDEVAQSIRSEASFDRVLAGWTGGTSPNTTGFYNAMSGGGEHQMVRRLGSLTMNVDLRCVQCHDSLIDGAGRQDDYWSFAAFLRYGLKRDPASKQWVLRGKKEPRRPVYYALRDGRQRVADSIVPERWLSRAEPIDSVKAWSDALVDSPELARGIVNSLWELVHERPLQGRVVDTVTAPHHEALDRLEDRLTVDLVDSGFDIGRTLSLIIASPVTRRSVPEALLPENALVAQPVVDQAMQSVNAFAAALPSHTRLPFHRRLDIAMQRVGAKIDDVDSVLAQNASETPDGPVKAAKLTFKAGSDFPSKASGLPVQWLASIPSDQARIEHLGYLAGMSRVPQELIDAAKAIGEADQDPSLKLQRVWWLVRP